MTTALSIPSHLKELLVNLEFLAMIEAGMKPCITDMTFVDASSWLGAIKRSRNAESKKVLLDFIEVVIGRTFSCIQDTRNKEYEELLITALAKAKIGICNTIETYKEHPSFISKVRVIITEIERHLAGMSLNDDSIKEDEENPFSVPNLPEEINEL